MRADTTEVKKSDTKNMGANLDFAMILQGSSIIRTS